MCGVVAAFAEPGRELDVEAVRAAMARMRRRGPDGDGLWQEPAVAMGHRRLAIIDLDQRAAQPMHSACGRYVIVFNGEIYNFRELRAELEAKGAAFRTTSDTETVLALFAAEGEAMLSRLHGMFAFVIWDRVGRRGFAARDAYGIKQLYIARVPNGVLLASQVKALLATGLVSRDPCAHGQAGFWMLGSVPEPHTWFRDVQALPAGRFAWIEDGRVTAIRPWLDLGALWRNAEHHRPRPDVAEAVRDALLESVRRHLVSDVPVGVFLSGGIDSGSLAALMIESGAQSLEGVTITYDEFSGRPDDEAPIAAVIAARYGLRHTVRRITRGEFLADLPAILDAMDQPSIDGVNTWYASKAVAERGLKVVVSGVGGDELFQGYTHFVSLPRLVRWRRWPSWVPGARKGLAMAGRLLARRSGNLRWRMAEPWTRTIEGAWWLRRSLCTPQELPTLIGAELANQVLRDFDVVQQVRSMTGELPADPRLALSAIESATYLRNQLLRDSDWASMSHSVELRTPLVDTHLLTSLEPWLASFGGFPGKALLANAPRPPLGSDVTNRRKTGFGIPVSQWLQGDRHSLAQAWAPRVASQYALAP
jgi:asparagine synthase (glutamine-hydrolysing)